MPDLKERFVVDAEGQPSHVLLDMEPPSRKI